VAPHIHTQGFGSASLQGSLVIIASEVAFGLGAIYSQKLITQGVSSMTLNGFQLFFGSIGLFILSLLFEPNALQLNQVSILGVGALLYLTVFGSLIAHGIFYWLIERTNPLFPSTFLYVSPMIALFVGYVWIHEKIHLGGLIGSVVIIFGVFFTNLMDWQKGFSIKERERKVA
jgi:drug/metabolite transporter (DMT)-like permease